MENLAVRVEQKRELRLGPAHALVERGAVKDVRVVEEHAHELVFRLQPAEELGRLVRRSVVDDERLQRRVGAPKR